MSGTSTLRTGTFTCSMADLGPESVLPMIGPPLETAYRITGAVPQEIIDGSDYGNPANLYPYRAQDDYGRERTERRLLSVTLENDSLRAVFLPELGGRLWELFDKTTGKPMLHTPPAIQFANLALRGAWFAGGIEWNIGTRGHSPTTCGRLHAASLRSADGQQVLRMWEFDRLREVVFQIDAWLPPESALLFVAVRIRNPRRREVPMYWWSNAAVPLQEGTRVLAPADTAFGSDHERGIRRVVHSADDGIDCTWPARNPRARDFFFDVPPDSRPWILAADEDGDGLAMLSTRRLRGRKLFVWGEGTGGRRWQDWLNPEGGKYAEIQAGLAQTQFQHLRMPAVSAWSWVEAYGNARLDPGLAHSSTWRTAREHGQARIDGLLSERELNRAAELAGAWADTAPEHPLCAGSGWGALESQRAKRSGVGWINERGTPFAEETITEEQEPWQRLLTGSAFDGARSFVRGADWERLLESQEATSAALLHLGTMKHARGDTGAARVLYRKSLATAPHDAADVALAHRGLAMIASARTAGSTEHYRAACAALPHDASLLIEAATALLSAGACRKALGLIEHAETGPRRAGRLGFLRAQALAQAGRPDEAARILADGLSVPDQREGEDALQALWRKVRPEEPVPQPYRFDMS